MHCTYKFHMGLPSVKVHQVQWLLCVYVGSKFADDVFLMSLRTAVWKYQAFLTTGVRVADSARWS
jgi:hypothetical protein